MHQANGDTRLCTACIDHVDLVAVGRAVLRETGTKDLKLGGRGKGRGGSPPLPPRVLHRLSSSSGHGCTLAESTDVRTERDRRERERERERNGSPRSLLPRIRCAHTGNDAFPRLYVASVRVRACVFSTRFITELLMPRGEGAAVSSHPSTLIPRPSRPTSSPSTSSCALVVVVVALVVVVRVPSSSRGGYVFARRLIPGCHAITS